MNLAKRVLEEASSSCDAFPSLNELIEIMNNMREVRPIYAKDKDWESTKVPGISAVLECICEHIARGTSEDPHVRKMVVFTGLSPKDIWEIFDAWYEGKLHEKAKAYKMDSRGLANYLFSTKPWGAPGSESPDQSSSYSESAQDLKGSSESRDPQVR